MMARLKVVAPLTIRPMGHSRQEGAIIEAGRGSLS